MLRRILELGEKKPHEIDPPNAWVFRVLGLSQEKHVGRELIASREKLYIGSPGGKLKSFREIRRVPKQVYWAIESWMAYSDQPEDLSRAVCIMICNTHGYGILLQRKNDDHPIAECRRLYSLFGGLPHTQETNWHAAYRELLEEIRSKEIRKHLHRLRKVESKTLPLMQWPGQYRCEMFSLVLPDNIFLKLVQQSVFDGNVSEGIGSVISIREFRFLHEQEEANPGQHFIASHHKAIECILLSDLDPNTN